MEQTINNHFTSTEPEFEKEREELDEKKNDHYFQQRQRIVIVFVYEHMFCKIEECDSKRNNIINNIKLVFVIGRCKS